MFKRVQISGFVLSVLVATSMFASSCGGDSKKEDDPDPNAQVHDIKLTYQFTNAPTSTVGPQAYAAWFTKDGGYKGEDGSKTGALSGETKAIKMGKLDKIEVALYMYEITTAAKAAALPSTTKVSATIVVDGVAKKTVTADKNTPVRQDPTEPAGTVYLHSYQTFTIGDLL